MKKNYELPFYNDNLKMAGLCLVVSEETFDRVVDCVEGAISLDSGSRVGDNQRERIRKDGIIPLIMFGSRTEPIFSLLSVRSGIKLISVVRRGFYRTEYCKKLLESI